MNKKPIRMVVFLALMAILIGLLCIIWNDKLILLSKSANNDDTGRFSKVIVNLLMVRKRSLETLPLAHMAMTEVQLIIELNFKKTKLLSFCLMTLKLN